VFSRLSIVLLDVLEKLRHENHVDTYTELTKHIHFYPDFHGAMSYRFMLIFLFTSRRK
jgi:hypothetical protein